MAIVIRDVERDLRRVKRVRYAVSDSGRGSPLPDPCYRMTEGGVGRLLVASLHQGIADLLPSRLEFYEAWLNPSGLRDGRIGLAPLAAVLSFLRLEGKPYRLIAARAGEYTAEWTVAELSGFKRAIIRA